MKRFIPLILFLGLCFIFTICFLLPGEMLRDRKEYVMVAQRIFTAETAQADISGNGITKDTIVFECSYGNVTFTHKKHNVDYKIDCYNAKCHHTWDKDNNQKSGDLCRDCHKAKAEGNTPSKKDAFHKSCKSCHEDRKKEGKPTGPTACKECHKKK